MNDDFAQLLACYDRCGPDATGHGAVEIGDDEAELIEKFIAGMCNASERRQVVRFLRSHPHLMIQIAERIKAARGVSDDTTGGLFKMKEFHIFASHCDTCFTMKGIPGGDPLVFSSLFEAARHARTVSGSDDGFVMIYGEDRQAANRIPFYVRS